MTGKRKRYLLQSHFTQNLRSSKILLTHTFIYYTLMIRLKGPLHLNLWFHLGGAKKLVVI